MIQITIRRGDDVPRQQAFTGRFTIGREESCDLRLPDSEVSRLHAVIHETDGTCVVVDQGSLNGTSIGGRRLPKGEPANWPAGEELQIRDFRLQLQPGEIAVDLDYELTIAPIDPAIELLNVDLVDQMPDEIVWDGTEMPFVVADVIRETSDVRTYRMISERRRVFRYKPGQFVGITVEIDGKPVRRTYSISSSPSRPYTLDITVKQIPGGLVSNWLADNVTPGDRIMLKRPGGKFTCFEHPSPKLLFLAAGSGITPLMSMLRWIVDTSAPVNVHFLYSARTPEDVIFGRELSSFAERHSGVTVSIVITGSSESARGWPGICGRIDQSRVEVAVPDYLEREVFLCGPTPFSDAAKSCLASLGVRKERVHHESFGGAKRSPAKPPVDAVKPPQPTPLPPAPPRAEVVAPQVAPEAAPAPDPQPVRATPSAAAAPAAVTGFRVRFRQSNIEVPVQGDLTILELAEEAGIELESSCREGMCGTCKTLKRSGEVVMEDNDLSPDELAEGYIYACVSRACSDVDVDA